MMITAPPITVTAAAALTVLPLPLLLVKTAVNNIFIVRNARAHILVVNGLKQVNDRLGHEAGDAVILSFADILRSIVTPQQILCRWGGDEFAIYVPHADASLLQHILEQIRTAVDKHNTSALVPKVQYAAGFAASSDHPDLSRRELFRLADARMYKDKNK